MKKRFSSFLAGVCTALLVVTLTTSALAASGKVSYNFANVALNGQQKITAGVDITAANGQKVPSSILYTDAVGGKTNYLPIRAICDLLGVEIGYDSATRTVLLGEQPQTQAAPTASTASASSATRQWKRTWDGNSMTYTSTANGNTSFNEPPAWRLTTVPEGWKLHDVHIMGQNGNCTWMYRKGKDSLTFTCRYLGSSRVGLSLRSEADASSVYHAATVNGASADFYQDEGQGILIWENMEGMLCQLKGPLSQTELETIASTAAKTKANALPVYQLGWVPEGSTNPSRATLREAVQEGWTGPDQVTFHWMYAAASAGALAEPDGTPETVTVNGIQAKYWAGDPDAEGRITISRGPDDDSMQKVLESPAEGQLNTLMWTDTATGITFRIQGEMDKSILIRMAENVAIKK